MAKKKSNNEADVQNRNIGTKGTNVTSAKAEGNRSKQLVTNKAKVAKAAPTKTEAKKQVVTAKPAKKNKNKILTLV